MGDVPGRRVLDRAGPGVHTSELTDDTLGGYQRVHERAPAFGGPDGHAYSVAPFVDDVPDASGRYGAALLFIRWSEVGDRPVGHVETDYLAFAATPDAALAPVLDLTLRAVKDHLDRCIELASAAGHDRGVS